MADVKAERLDFNAPPEKSKKQGITGGLPSGPASPNPSSSEADCEGGMETLQPMAQAIQAKIRDTFGPDLTEEARELIFGVMMGLPQRRSDDGLAETEPPTLRDLYIGATIAADLVREEALKDGLKLAGTRPNQDEWEDIRFFLYELAHNKPGNGQSGLSVAEYFNRAQDGLLELEIERNRLRVKRERADDIARRIIVQLAGMIATFESMAAAASNGTDVSKQQAIEALLSYLAGLRDMAVAGIADLANHPDAVASLGVLEQAIRTRQFSDVRLEINALTVANQRLRAQLAHRGAAEKGPGADTPIEGTPQGEGRKDIQADAG